MSLAGISQSSIDSLGTFLTFLVADSSAEDARALGGRSVEVGEDETDRDDFEGLQVMHVLLLLLLLLENSWSSWTMPCAEMDRQRH
jgi:hypothetical protein